ncbi:glycosyltransferase [Roseivivax isoporae]|uniref:Glycosyl transferase n=1 Tax=Roseivivax isoporae LMG 25204 TaxID=1449351 RepID=X7FC87_9RHOB|nr:glycosyltransferase family 2 protein [Roseivivax isoporae]ETX30430.1 glycosyl transferase [Roseivivax isoporae LMG 25204]
MSTPRLLTVILNWRTPEMTLRAAEAAACALDGLDGEIVIVDNCSGDGSEEKLRAGVAEARWARDLPVRVIQSGRNGGFGAGNNAGIRAGRSDGVRPDYVYILNSDAFPDPSAIAVLLHHLESHPWVGIAGSFIYGEDGIPHATAFRFPSIASEFEGAARIGLVSKLMPDARVSLGVPNATRKVDWLAGASMLMRMDILDRSGLFDEAFFLYFEETELCRRVAALGAEVHYVLESRVMHLGSVSTGMRTWVRVPEYWYDSRWHYFTKTRGRAYAACATLAHLAGGVLCRLKLGLLRRPRVDPRRFLRTLAAHDARALLSRAHRPGSHPSRRPLGAPNAEDRR